MPRKRSAVTLLAFVVALAAVADGAAACGGPARHHARRVTSGGDSGVTLVVRNDNFADLDVRVIGYGMETRLGIVPGNLTQQFALGEWVARSPDLLITATPLGGSSGATSGHLVVQLGQTIEFTIGTRLWQSSVYVR